MHPREAALFGATDGAFALGNGIEATAARWSLHLLGGFKLSELPDGTRITVPGKRERVLLAYLALSPNCRQTRRKLATLLWGDATDETALDNLRTCVWSLRKALGHSKHRVINSQGEDIVLDASAFNVDALAFRRLAAQPGKVELEAAAHLYAGAFLDGLGIENEEYESWRREEAGRCKDQALDVLTRLMAQMADCGEIEPATEVGLRILRLEPLHEEATRRLMRLYAQSGRRGAAIQLYRTLADALKTELGAQPEAETRALFAEIGRGGEERTQAPVPPADPVAIDTKAPLADRAPSDKPSIAVLAFQNMSGDPEQEFFADGIAEDIITALSKSRGLFVIARNSSFTYKNKTLDVRQIGCELGVRYVLEGSVRKVGNRVRITAQLVDTTDGHHVWAERYDRTLEDIFAIQDELTHNIIGAIAPGIVAAEIQRSLSKEVADLGQWERLMRAHWHARRFTPEDCEKAIALLGDLVRHEPNNALALSDLAWALHFGGSFGWTKEPRLVAMGLAGQYARRAVAADDQEAAAHAMIAISDVFAEGHHDDGIRRLKRAIELDPNSSVARGFLGAAYAFGGECEPALQHLREAMRLSPRDFLMVLWNTANAVAYLSADRFEEAADSAKRAIECNPAFPDTHGFLAVASAYLGRMAEARAAVVEYARLLPGLTVHDGRRNLPFRRAADRERWFSGLSKAGLPE